MHKSKFTDTQTQTQAIGGGHLKYRNTNRDKNRHGNIHLYIQTRPCKHPVTHKHKQTHTFKTRDTGNIQTQIRADTEANR